MKELMRRLRFAGWILLTSLVPVAVAADWDEIAWFDDASGYAEAMVEAEKSGTPVLVYFYTDWCPYCRQLNQQILTAGEVQAELGQMLAVRVNAERGPKERSLALQRRVRGYPALFIWDPGPGGGFLPIRRTVSNGTRVRLKTPEEFVATLRSAGRRQLERHSSP
ncbi:MAG: thioredoxin family protein [Acidobacteria bacterium]|nr:thioredoxin family protein [Acidobacteriota bacterium]